MSGTKPTFIEYENLEKYRGRYLPHWEAQNGIYFVTFRIKNSLPSHQARRIRKLYDKKRSEFDENPSSSNRFARWHADFFVKHVDRSLDRSDRKPYLKHKSNGKLVAEALQYFHEERYLLYSWAVMPNHVHVVFQTLNGHRLQSILHSWKSYTAQKISSVYKDRGSFWQDEYYDHLVRTVGDFQHFCRYVLENPEVAGLDDWDWCGEEAVGALPGRMDG
jgi:REP element-mobilizing transposase RayT